MMRSLLVQLLLLPLSAVAFSSISPSLDNSAASSKSINPLADIDFGTTPKLPWLPQGYSSWDWRGHKINYMEAGDPSNPQKLVLVHGFGASGYHFRDNLPELSKDYHVFTMDMLGFGLSEKPLVEYGAYTWGNQTMDFLKEVVQGPAVVAGNSLGGYTALVAASTASPLVKGCVLLNSAGAFRSPDTPAEPEEDTTPAWVKSIQQAFQRFIINLSFVYTKQPLRIAQVLKQVYPVGGELRVDDDLVESIRFPADDPNAPEVFYRVITREGQPQPYNDDLLETTECPILLCWGMQDPWIRPKAADSIESLYKNNRVDRVELNAGHCPHDETPAEVNEAIRNFMESF